MNLNPNTATPIELEAAAVINEAEDIITGAALMEALPPDATFGDMRDALLAEDARIAAVTASLAGE
jgi:hypothetical protein